MKKLTIFLFLLAAATIAVLFFRERFFPEQVEEIHYSKIVTPITQQASVVEEIRESASFEQTQLISYIPLQAGDTLLKTFPVKFSASQATDEIEDQVCAIRRAGNPYIVLLLAVYNVQTQEYEQSLQIETEVQQINTLSVSAIDVIGEHKNALVYTGFTYDNNTVLQIYQSDIRFGRASWTKIADLKSEGTISVEETARSDAYAMGQVNGDSYSIIENRPFTSDNGNLLDQLQITWKYNRRTRLYQQDSEKLVANKTVNKQELSRILDGTTETFSAFLDGLWYKTVNKQGDDLRYVFFDVENREIICFTEATQEVYSWDSDWMRRSGMTMTTKNTSTAAISRRFDTTLTDTDEIKIKVTDEVFMEIKEDSLWDGTYRKQPSAKEAGITAIGDTEMLATLQTTAEKWRTHDTTELAVKGNTWTAEKGGIISSGVFIINRMQGELIIEFRPDKSSTSPRFTGYYRLAAADDGNSSTEELTLQAVTITMSGIASQGELIRLERNAQ
ncbi:MAG: pallilysin-related adhesin [Treponemataceae bacterium]|nr:pallilysin-related adhesin [Treponemataceae bacterium]